MTEDADDLHDRLDDLEDRVETLEGRLEAVSQDYVALDKIREEVDALKRVAVLPDGEAQESVE